MRYIILICIACITFHVQLHADAYQRVLFQKAIKEMDSFIEIDDNYKLSRYKEEASTTDRKLLPVVRSRHTHHQEKNEMITKLKKAYDNLSDDDKQRGDIPRLLKKLQEFEQRLNITIQKQSPPLFMEIIGISCFLIITTLSIYETYFQHAT